MCRVKMGLGLFLIGGLLHGKLIAADCVSRSTLSECLKDDVCVWDQPTFTCSESGSDPCSGLQTQGVCETYEACAWDPASSQCYIIHGLIQVGSSLRSGKL